MNQLSSFCSEMVDAIILAAAIIITWGLIWKMIIAGVSQTDAASLAVAMIVIIGTLDSQRRRWSGQ